MANSKTRLNYDELELIAKCLHHEGDDIAQLRSKTNIRMNALRHEWTGNAADSFFNEMESKLLPGVQRLSMALFEAEKVLHQIVQTIRDADQETSGYFKGIDMVKVPDPAGTGKRTRIYLINGINYNGDNSSMDDLTRMLKEKYGSNVDIRIVGGNDIGSHPYNTNLQKYQINLSGTSFGGWLSPVDWLTGKISQGINSSPAAVLWGAGLGVANSVVGVSQVVHEYVTGGSAESQKAFQWIQDDLGRNGLIGDKDLNVLLVGHSGGGAIAGNIAGDIEHKLNVNVTGIVTMGSPISNYDLASQHVENFIDIRNQSDLVGTPLGLGNIRSDEIRLGWQIPFNIPERIAYSIGSLTGMDQFFRNSDINVQNVMTQDGGYHQWNPFEWVGAHGSYWNSPTVVNAIGSLL